MNKSMVVRFSLLSTLFILIGACAKISSPSGGSRDRRPPVVIKSIPEYGAKNFREKSISITFDEYVVLDNISEKFMVSPPMKKKPRIFIKGKRIVTEFEEDLKDSTTYTFNFQDAIKDLNEGNKIENYQFVLSTGSVVDSLSVTGNVYNAFNLEVPEKTLVLLYKELADSFVVRHLPDYISRVDQKGYFRINNIQAGIYRLYALKDADNSKNFNFPEEEFAFMNSSIEITPEKNFIPVVIDTALKKEVSKVRELSKTGASKTKDISKKDDNEVQDTIVLKGEYPLMLFEGRKKSHYLTSSDRAGKYQMIYTLSLPPDSLPFSFSIPESGENSYFIERNKEKDTIKIWLTDSTLYLQPQITTIVNYPFTDTLGILGFKEDTIMMRFRAPRPARGAKVKMPEFKFETNIRNNSLKPGQQIILTSALPFRKPDTTRIRFYQVSDSIRVRIPYSIVKDSLNSCRYFVNTDLLQGEKYLFIADSASFGNIYNEGSDSIGIKFSIRDPDSYSKLTLKIHNYEGSRIIQLLSSEEKLVYETSMKSDGEVVLPMLEPGSYRLKSIYDLNDDGKWTTGDFDTGRQPEPVSYYPDEIDLKVGWEIEQDWDIGEQFAKNEKLREKKTSKK
jgi:hypothetical protein